MRHDDVSELRILLNTMSVPEFRRELSLNNLLWLQRNLRINNGNHRDINTAMHLIKSLVRSHAGHDG